MEALALVNGNTNGGLSNDSPLFGYYHIRQNLLLLCGVISLLFRQILLLRDLYMGRVRLVLRLPQGYPEGD